jgi:manganese/zinc/iron transport system ATP- binding protein
MKRSSQATVGVPQAELSVPDAVQIAGLCAQYAGTGQLALDRVTLRVRTGARAAVIGANGAGKSTLLKAIVGLVPVTAGTLEIHGGSFRSCRQRVAYLPQVAEVDWRFPVSVARLVLSGRYVHLGWLRRPGRAERDLARESMERLGIDSLAERQIGQLSGGQRQRALLARALVQQADLVLLDEPFAAVDTESRSVVLDVLDQLRQDGITVLLATHELDHLAIDPTDIVRLADGRVVTQCE